MKTNPSASAVTEYTHEGAIAARINPEQRLRRSVLACMLWEDEFYEDGASIAARIAELVPQVRAERVRDLAIEARERMKLRHAPLWLCVAMLAAGGTHRRLAAGTIAAVIQRADEPAELLALYWKEKKRPLAAQLKRGLAQALLKFDAYQLAKYAGTRDAIKLRDVIRLAHPKPPTPAHEALLKQALDGTLPLPETWEVELTRAHTTEEKRAAWASLLARKKLGALALLRNLRNMTQAEVDPALIRSALGEMKTDRVLPFRFLAAARAVPALEADLEPPFLRAAGQGRLPGKTVLIVDVSGSMYCGGTVSRRSDLTRVDAAAALAAIFREACESVALYATAGDDGKGTHATAQVAPRRGFALVDLFGTRGFARELGGGGIFLTQCLDFVRARERTADRVVVFTDEQDCDQKANPATADAFGAANYLINVSSHQSGIGYGKWTHIDGWSEAVLDYIREAERDEPPAFEANQP